MHFIEPILQKHPKIYILFVYIKIMQWSIYIEKYILTA